MNLLRWQKTRAMTVVTIDVIDHEPDALQRIALLNGAFFKVVAGGARLIEVRAADYREGHMEVVVEEPQSRPPSLGRVSVRYRPVG